MEMHNSTLPKFPPPVLPQDLFFSLEFKFDRTAESSHMGITCTRPVGMDLVRFWLPWKKEGAEALEGHPGYFSIALPCPGNETANVRLHLAVPVMDMDDLETRVGVEHSCDFDRLMEVLVHSLHEMVRVGALIPGKTGVDIIAEPLTATGELKSGLIDQIETDIGASGWLQLDSQYLFRCFRKWNPVKGAWEDSNVKIETS